jgi:hypothetical protein
MSRRKTGVRRRRATKRKRVGGGVGTMLKRAFDFSRRRHKTEVHPSTLRTHEWLSARSRKFAVLPIRRKKVLGRTMYS